MEKQTWKNVTIVLLSVAMVISVVIIVILSRRLNTQNFIAGPPEKYAPVGIHAVDTVGPVEERLGRDNVDSFHSWVEKGRVAEGAGVYYSPGDLANFETDVWKKIQDGQEKYIIEKGEIKMEEYEWKIGCYWMLNKDVDGLIKYDFCFAPALKHKESGKVIDFFRSNVYQRDLEITIPNRRSKSDTTVKTSVFNTGTMFP